MRGSRRSAGDRVRRGGLEGNGRVHYVASECQPYDRKRGWRAARHEAFAGHEPNRKQGDPATPRPGNVGGAR
jgi:hypothetical protein